MTIIEAVKSVFRQYATFSGRAARSEFWWWQAFAVLVTVILAKLDTALFGLGETVGDVSATGFQASYNAGPLGGVWMLATLIPAIAVGARRLHDIDRSGWWQLLVFLPVIGWIVLLYWLVKRGIEGENRFGSNPTGVDTKVFQ